MIRKYELMFLFKPTLDDKEVAELKKNIEVKINGTIVKQEDWGKKELSYEIKKQKEAIYVLYYVETDSDNIDEVKNMVAIEKDVLRNLIIRHEKKWPFEAKQLDLSLLKTYGKRKTYKRHDQ